MNTRRAIASSRDRSCLASLSLNCRGIMRAAALSLAALGAASSVLGDQILQISGDPLTAYQATAARVQLVRPRHDQRGVNIDGTLRVRAALPWAMAGNPFGESWDSNNRLGDLRVDLGTYQPTDVDLALPATGFSWVIGRTFNARQDSSGHLDSDGPQGYNWFQASQPEMRLYEHVSDNTKDAIYLVFGADRYVEFIRTGESSTEYKSKNGAAGGVQYASGSPDTWTYTDQHGNATVFFGDNTSSDKADWQIWKMTDPAGNVAYVGDASTASTAVTDGFNTDGTIAKAYDTSDRRYTYTYSTIDSVSRLTQVKAETKTGGTWASPSGVTEVGKVDYAYYQAGDNTYGDNGTLKMVTVTTPLSTGSLVQKKYYRYWTGAYNASTNPGHAKTLKLVLGFEGARKYDWDQDSTLDDDFLSASTDNLKAYADAYFEYDSSYRINKAFFSGECGCSGGNNGEYEFTYAQASNYSTLVGNTSYDTDRALRTVINRPDNTYETRYFDETGQPLGKVVTDIVPTSTDPAPQFWATYVERNASGQITEIRTPNNITAYTHDSGGNMSGAMTASSSAGLIWLYSRKSASSDTDGFVAEEKFKDAGTGQTSIFLRTHTYAHLTKTVGAVTVTRPVISNTTDYFARLTSTSSTLTEVSPNDVSTTDHSGSTTLAVKSSTRTSPKVATSANGRGDGGGDYAVEGKTFVRTDGTPAFTHRDVYSDESASNRVYRYTQYTNGRLVKTIEDAKTDNSFASGDDPSTNFSITEASTGLNITTTYTYDAQGRLDETTLPDGRVTKMYYTKVADGRMVTLAIPRVVAGSPTYYGPVSYTVRNHAGRPELSGIIAISSSGSTTALSSWIDAADSDPITAVDVGTLARMTVNVYNKPGTRIEETRAYHDIPASGAGSSGTNYDKTLFGFDDMGRKWRTKTAAGTITRTVFDTMGRVTQSWIGTNDSSFSGGESSGTDTMVKTAVTEYDGNADKGNGYVTERTLDADGDWGGASDQRVTAYINDARGHAVLIENPQSPHMVNKFDNLGRVTASGAYSSLSGFTVSTNPTSETTGRLGLSETFYDVRGQVWKRVRHKIDASDGSDDDNIVSLSWFDPEKRAIKSRDASLTKTRFDRLGRVTHTFTLAKTNDSTYANVYTSAQTDVAGDDVLEEAQTTYDNNTGTVLMQATISRFHDDLASAGTGTAGALDTNADSLRLKYTAANVEGRIAFTSNWYDSLDRLTTTAAYGTNGSANASDFDRDGLSAPSSSDTVLVTTYSYNDDGTVLDVTDPRGKVTRTTYDEGGRKTATIANYVNGTPSGDNNDDDNYTRYVYTNGLQTKMWVDLDGDNVEDGTDQVTTYTFGTTKGVSAGDSNIATGHLLQKATYPDSASGSDVVTFAYNAQSQQMWTMDQSGNVIQTDFDTAGRATQKRATTVISGFDGTVKRIATTYTNRGQVQLVTQYDNATVGSGSVTDEVKHTYDDWGNVTQLEEDKDSAVSGGGNQYTLTWTYAKASSSSDSAEVVRCTNATLPGSGESASLKYEYDSASYCLDAAANRVTNVQTINGLTITTRAAYKYLGQSKLVGTTMAEASVYSRLYGSGTANYDVIDRFDRVTSSRWTKDLGTPRDFYKVSIAYDRSSNITSADDQVRVGFDVQYSMDSRNRLTRAEEGTWGGSSISSRTRDQQWTLSQPGNWYRNKLDLDGDGNFTGGGELDETNTFNVVNELTGRDTDSNASDNYSPTYDAVGDMTDDGKDYTYVYDVFGRLVTVKTRGGSPVTVAEYRYNGLNWRIGWHSDVTRSGGGDPDGTVDANDPWYYTVHDTKWRMVAVFRGSDANPKERFVWHEAGLLGRGGSSYIDTVIFRDRDANSGWTSAADGTLEERVYYCQNWRADVSVELSSSGLVKEWVKYSAYGVPYSITPGDFDADGFLTGNDSDEFDTAYNGGAGSWDARVDLNLDGSLTSADETIFTDEYNNGEAAGLGVLSRSMVASRIGYAGYQHARELAGAKWHVRHRVFDSETGRWTRRNPLGYIDGPSQYLYVGAQPVFMTDPTGLPCQPVVGCGGDGGAIPPEGPRWHYPSVPCGHEGREWSCMRWARQQCDEHAGSNAPNCIGFCYQVAASCCNGEDCNAPGAANRCLGAGISAMVRCNLGICGLPAYRTCVSGCLTGGLTGTVCGSACRGCPMAAQAALAGCVVACLWMGPGCIVPCAIAAGVPLGLCSVCGLCMTGLIDECRLQCWDLRNCANPPQGF